jgi:7-cyano-7-deazaguanine synthase
MSGGIDSMACSYFLQRQGFKVNGLFVNYNQVAKEAEAVSAKKVSQYLDISLERVHASVDKVFKDGEIIGRNAFLLSLAVLYFGEKSGSVAIGIHKGTPYYDSSESFFKDFSKIIAQCSDGTVSLLAPFITWEKGQVYKYCTDNKMPLEITYSCELGTLPPCGKCLSCRDRNEAGIS